MLNITLYQRNANQNHNEVPFHASQNGYDPEVYKQYMLEWVWRKWNPLTVLVGMKTSTAATENSVQILKKKKKLEIELQYDPEIPLFCIHTEETRIERDTCTQTFIAVLFLIATIWKHPR